MTHTYNISGMTCGNCLAKAKSALLKIGDVTEAELNLTAPQATITMQRHIPVPILQAALAVAGNYTISEAEDEMHNNAERVKASWLTIYKPILLIGIFITGISLMNEFKTGFMWERWMQNFMAGFFLTFSFFKLLDLKSFAKSYSTYDIIAKRWAAWGYIYAFAELGLGILYLLAFAPFITNLITFILMSISIIGVLQSLLNRRKIRCACLGAVFNLPMSSITLIEDGLMIVMSLFMLLSAV